MKAQEKSQAQAENELMTFQFSESKTTVRTLYDNDDILFVGSDVAKVLGYKNSRKAISDHCKGVTKRYILTKGGRQKVNMITEGDVFRLIVNSELPTAQSFESWVMDEVLPSIRKKGYYKMHRPTNDYIDARDVPYFQTHINNCSVRYISLNGVSWLSINDINKALGSSTGSNQISKKLNAKQNLAKKIWIFGNTNPSWFTNQLGLQLMLSGSRKFNNQLHLPL